MFLTCFTIRKKPTIVISLYAKILNKGVHFLLNNNAELLGIYGNLL